MISKNNQIENWLWKSVFVIMSIQKIDYFSLSTMVIFDQKVNSFWQTNKEIPWPKWQMITNYLIDFM